MNAADIIIIIGSLALVVVVGLFAGRKQSESPEDFFLASGRMPWWIIGTAFVSASVSNEQIVGNFRDV